MPNLKLADWSLYLYRLPYEREVKWANAVESAGTLALLRLVSDGGSVGIAEGTINENRSGVSPRSLAAALDGFIVPRLNGLDLADAESVSRALGSIPDNRQAKAMVETACWTMRAAAAGQPLWRLWGGTRSPDVTFTLTLQAPASMAAEAAVVCARHGFRSLRTTALRASTATPAGTTTCSRTRARPGTSARAATRSACCSTPSGSRRTCSRRCPTASTCSPSRSSCGPPSGASARGWGSFAGSPRDCWPRRTPKPHPARTRG